MRIFSCIVAGLARVGVDDFLDSLSSDHLWDILLLQEFSGCLTAGRVHREHYYTTNGHVVFVVPPCPGCRATAIVVNGRVSHGILHDSFRYQGRASRLLMHWEGHNINSVTSHLVPMSGTLEYSFASLEDLELMLDKKDVGSLSKNLERGRSRSTHRNISQYWGLMLRAMLELLKISMMLT